VSSPEDEEQFDCRDCGVNTSRIGEYYMVTGEVWQQAGGGDAMLCVGCLEKRLGRELRCKDFTWAPINLEAMLTGSPRLRKRMDEISFLLDLRYFAGITRITITDDLRVEIQIAGDED
jgi:hypothetical protein